VTHIGSNQLAPEGASVRNPAFDVTPSKYISAIITERGVVRPPYAETLTAPGPPSLADNPASFGEAGEPVNQ
jgi:methylthioribose-1-phosphate isomerase